jgi:hypothetical protein
MSACQLSAQSHERKQVNEFRQCLRLATFALGELALEVLAIEQLLEPVVQGRRQAKLPPVVGQLKLNENGLGHDALL